MIHVRQEGKLYKLFTGPSNVIQIARSVMTTNLIAIITGKSCVVLLGKREMVDMLHIKSKTMIV